MEKAKQLPKKINLFNFAKRELNLEGDYKISNLSRLSEIARNNNDRVEVDLSFHLENGKTPCVEGIINLQLVLDCQRCLDDLEVDLNVTFNIAFVRHQSQADSLEDKYEIYLVGNNEELETKDLITDEILLSIPMAPSHDFDCGLKIDKEDKVEEVREHPFDVLKNIK
ncbi:MAG: YceD family protein [Pseudomonadota bacterium]|nr:YceD family protein [Pseudomonadota bacterium]